MRLLLSPLLAAGMSLSSSAFAQGPARELKFGAYRSIGTVHFTQVRLSNWASRAKVLSGNVTYAGYAFPFDVELKSEDGGQLYTGRGKFKIGYDDGITCEHYIRIDLYPQADGTFFLKHLAPASVYVEKIPGGECPDAAADYGWTRHPNAYVWVGP